MQSGMRILKMKMHYDAIPSLCFALIVASFIVIPFSQNSFGLGLTTFPGTDSCVKYKKEVNLIQIFCKSVHLTDIEMQLKDTRILGRETPIQSSSLSGGIFDSLSNSKLWILNSGIEIEKEATLIIDS